MHERLNISMKVDLIFLIISSKPFFPIYYLQTVWELTDSTNCSVWSKTTLFIGGVGETGVDPPNCKMGTFILLSLTIAEPSLINFQLNGVKMFREFFKNITRHFTDLGTLI